jgi:hypothetical protein
MLLGAALIAAGCVGRLRKGIAIIEDPAEVGARRSSWPRTRLASASVAVGTPIFLLGAMVALVKSVPVAAAVLAVAYVIMMLIGLTLGRPRRRDRPPKNVWERFVDVCGILADLSP